MKLKYIGKGTLRAKGHRFEPGETYELLEDTYNYMVKTFGSIFEVVEAPKAAKVEEPKEESEAPKKKPRTKRAVAPKE